MIPVHHPAHQANDDEDESRYGTLTDAILTYASSSTSHSPSQLTSLPGKNGRNGGTGPDEATEPAGTPNADAGGVQPDQTPSPGGLPERAVEPAASGESPETSGDDDLVAGATTYSQVRSTSRGYWGLTFLSSLGILLSVGALTIIASSIQQFTDFGGLSNSAVPLGQITRTWPQLVTDESVRLLVTMLPAFLVLLTTLHIALSAQGSHSPDRNDRVTNEQVALQQVREGIILLLSGLTGMTIILTTP